VRSVNSPFRAKLQLDGGQITELIDLVTPLSTFHWTTNVDPVYATWSGAVTLYEPFPGMVPTGIQESTDLAVNAIDFVLANSGDTLKQLMPAGDFHRSDVAISRVFVDTPDLARMYIWVGEIGDYIHDRQVVTGQARNLYQSLAINWPPYTYGDTCGWRFGSAGCGINPASFGLSVSTATILSGTTNNSVISVTTGYLSNSYASGVLDFGRVTITGGVNSGAVRTVRVHTNDLLYLSHPLAINSNTNLRFDLWPGCRKRLTTDCVSKFNNARNFLGFPWIPIQEQII
jgi:uncharacterized phage protein (TIGR02218 family)